MRTPLLAATLTLALAAAGCAGPLLPGSGPAGTAHPAPAGAAAALTTPGDAPGTATAVRGELAALPTAAPHPLTGFSRTAFGLWTRQADRCATWQEALRRTAENPVRPTADCTPASGTWYSAYDGTTVPDASRAVVDQVVPLAEAWRSGADRWTPRQRAAFGNDLDDPQLVVVSASAAAAKGDHATPGHWRPANPAARCGWAEDYTHVKYRFRLTTTPAERAALERLLAGCS